MNGWPLRWYLRLVTGPDRTVLMLAGVVRLAGLAMLFSALPLVWTHLRYPGWTLLLVLGLSVETALVLWYWLRHRRPARITVVVDVAAGLLAMLASGALSVHPGVAGWTDIAYPYVVLVALAIGVACRTPAGAAAAGLVLAVGKVVVAWRIDEASGSQLVGLAPAFLLNAVVGALAGRLLRRTVAELDRVRDEAVDRARAVATEQERLRHARILHDRVLQTLETLARGSAVDDPGLRAAVVEQAGWLRRYIESGDPEQGRDLSSALTAVASLVRRTGVTVELNDAALRTDGSTRLGEAALEALVEAVHGTLLAVGRVSSRLVVRAEADAGGVLITVLGAADPAGELDTEAVDRVRERLLAAGGELVLEPMPYAELRLPGAT